MRKVIYATRRSPLALAQCRALVGRLRAANPGVTFDELLVVTSGDRIQDVPLTELGGKGLFVKEIEEALLDGRADMAVHSIKDVPALLAAGLAIGAIPLREDPRDALVSPRYGTLAALPRGARVGSSSLRRAVGLRVARPDLDVVPLRGNIDTRLRKVDAGDYDAIVLARAGLLRLGLEGRATEVLEPEVLLPAVGQGALGIEVRAGDDDVQGLLAPLHDPTTARCVAAERGVMVALEGDCRTPLAAFAERVPAASGDALRLRAFVAEPDGKRLRRGEEPSPWPSTEDDARALGLELGERLKAR